MVDWILFDIDDCIVFVSMNLWIDWVAVCLNENEDVCLKWVYVAAELKGSSLNRSAFRKCEESWMGKWWTRWMRVFL